MLDRLKRRAAKEGLAGRVDARPAAADSMGLADLQGMVDFTAAFYVVHEFPYAGRFFADVGAASKAGASLLLAEPKGRVKATAFESELEAASTAGFAVVDRRTIRRSVTTLLKRT